MQVDGLAMGASFAVIPETGLSTHDEFRSRELTLGSQSQKIWFFVLNVQIQIKIMTQKLPDK